jgi:hypothetical protein
LKSPNLQLVEKIELPNRLTLELYDYSRLVAGDRWFVGLLARIPVTVREEDLSEISNEPSLRAEFTETKGHTLYFELKEERNFIDARERDRVFKNLLGGLKEQTLSYMGNEAFARGVLRREFADFKRKRNWWT